MHNFRKATAGMREVATLAALPAHDGIIRLLDVGLIWGRVLAAFPLYDASLHEWPERSARPLDDEEIQHVASVLLHALAHMHRCGVVHCDVKPGTILASGPGLRKRCDFAESASCAACAAQLRRLPHLLRVFLFGGTSALPVW